MEYDLIITIINRGFADLVMDAARSKGATGGTITHGRGTGDEELSKFCNISVSPEKEMVWILVPREIRAVVLEEIAAKAGLKTQGQGIAFSVPVDEVIKA